MISRTPPKVPGETQDLGVYLLRQLRDHYQDLLDIYSGDAEVGDTITFVGADATWRLHIANSDDVTATVEAGDFLVQRWIDDEWKTANSFREA